MVTIACVHDSKATYLLVRYLRKICFNIKVILADAGYRGEIADKIKPAFGYTLEVFASGDKVNDFKSIGKRWILDSAILKDTSSYVMFSKIRSHTIFRNTYIFHFSLMTYKLSSKILENSL